VSLNLILLLPYSNFPNGRGSGPEFSSSFFFLAGGQIFEALRRTKKTDRQGSFFDNLVIALPDTHHFDGDPQPRWEIRLKIGDRHRMLNLFQHAVTIAFFIFCSARLASKITRFCSFRRLFEGVACPSAPPFSKI